VLLVDKEPSEFANEENPDASKRGSGPPVPQDASQKAL